MLLPVCIFLTAFLGKLFTQISYVHEICEIRLDDIHFTIDDDCLNYTINKDLSLPLNVKGTQSYEQNVKQRR